MMMLMIWGGLFRQTQGSAGLWGGGEGWRRVKWMKGDKNMRVGARGKEGDISWMNSPWKGPVEDETKGGDGMGE